MKVEVEVIAVVVVVVFVPSFCTYLLHLTLPPSFFDKMESSYTTPPLNPEEPDQQVDNGSTMDPIQEEIPEEMELKINEGRIKHNSYDDTHFDNNIEHCNALTNSSETGIYMSLTIITI